MRNEGYVYIVIHPLFWLVSVNPLLSLVSVNLKRFVVLSSSPHSKVHIRYSIFAESLCTIIIHYSQYCVANGYDTAHVHGGISVSWFRYMYAHTMPPKTISVSYIIPSSRKLLVYNIAITGIIHCIHIERLNAQCHTHIPLLWAYSKIWSIVCVHIQCSCFSK